MNELLFSEIKSSKNELLMNFLLIEAFVFEQKPLALNHQACSQQTSQYQLAQLLASCQSITTDIKKDSDKAEALLNHFFVEQLFIDQQETIGSLFSHQLSSAILQKSIAPTLKAVLLTYIAEQCGLKADVVYLPNKIMVRFICEKNLALIFNPITGESLNWLDLNILLNESSAEPFAIQFNIMSRQSLLVEYINGIKDACIQEKQYQQALKCVDVLLALMPNNEKNQKSPGILLHQMNRFNVACDDENQFLAHFSKPLSKHLSKHLTRQGVNKSEQQALALKLDKINLSDTTIH